MPENSTASENAPKARFIGGKAFRVVKLEYPIEYGGKEYREIRLRRMTFLEMKEFIEDAAERDDVRPSIFDCPMEMLDHLDADDFENVDKAVRDFLPRRLVEVAERIRASGEDMQPSSPQNTDGAQATSTDSSGTTPSSGTNSQ
jgi:hypothetical protein